MKAKQRSGTTLSGTLCIVRFWPEIEHYVYFGRLIAVAGEAGRKRPDRSAITIRGAGWRKPAP